MMRNYYVLKVKELEIYFNTTRLNFYNTETWSKEDENSYDVIENSSKWNIDDIDRLKTFKKSHPNIDKNFEILEIVHFQINHYIKEKYEEN